MRVSALLAVPIALVGLAVPASAEDPGLTIIWPTATQIEVGKTSYTINIADTAAEPQGTLYAEWRGERLPGELPHSGDYTVNFPKGGIGDTIKVVRCVPADPEPACTEPLATSPQLNVWKNLDFVVEANPQVAQTGKQAIFFVGSENGKNATATVNWRLMRAGQEELSGMSNVALDDVGLGKLQISLPTTMPGGAYQLTMFTSADIAPFGPHSGTGSGSIDIDAAAPRMSLALNASSLYPAADGYRDYLRIRYGTNERVQYAVEVRNSAGHVVRGLGSGTMGDENSGESRSTYWYGKDSRGRLVPAGSYRVRLTGTDDAGRTTTVTKTVAVSHKKIQKRTWTRTFKAGATLTRNGAFVQACSTLRKPSLRGWAGSLGYYSRTKCNRNNADIVSTTNGVYVPKAFQNRYGTYQVSFYGGGARGTRGAYIVMGYLNNKNDFTHRIQGGAAVRSYTGKVASAGNFVHAKTTKPYVLWTAGLTDGSRYDVKSFTVRLTYTVLA